MDQSEELFDFSIVMPSYNRAGSIGESLQSVVDQLGDFSVEIIVVDDSTDQTPNVVEFFRRSNAGNVPITLIAGGRKRGVAKARNEGLEVARGRYIVFLDTDDSLLGGALQCLKIFFEENKGIDLYFGSIVAKSGRSITYVEHLQNCELDYKKYLVEEIIGEILPVCRKSVYANKELRFLEGVQGFEIVLWTKILRAGHKAYFGSKPLRFYNDLGLDRLSLLTLSGAQASNHARGYYRYFSEFGDDLWSLNRWLFKKNFVKLLVYNKFSEDSLPEVSSFVKKTLKICGWPFVILNMVPKKAYSVALRFYRKNRI